jgi:hypothetical protein
MTVLTYTPAREYLFGWCAACHREGRFVPAVDEGLQACQTHLRLLPRRPALAGQLTLDVDVEPVPPALRTPHATGVQLWCSDCVARGARQPRQGMPERTPGDATPLCLTCWRGRGDRARRGERRRGLNATEAGWIADLTDRLACEVCGRADGTGDCWRCGDQVTFLTAAREVHEQDQAQAAAELERVDELAGEHRAALERIRRAERRLQQLQQWHERVERVVTALPRLTKTGPRGQLEVAEGAGSWSRAWELLADFLARDAAERTARGLSRRGRPPEYPRVVAVMAVAASWESGRGSMAGLDWTALFAGTGERTVTTGWARTVELGCAELVERGRILTVEERRELRRHRQRAVYDFTQLHRSTFDSRPHLGTASALLAELLQRAGELVDEQQAVVEEERAGAAALEAELLDARAWAAEQRRDDLVLAASLDVAWAEEAERAVQLARTARGRASQAAAPPKDLGALVAAQRAAEAAAAASRKAVDTAFEQARRMTNFCDHPRRGPSSNSSSCSVVGFNSSGRSTSRLAIRRRPDGRGEGPKTFGASRSSTRSVAATTSPSRPRTLKRVGVASPACATRQDVMAWAKPLARALSGRWDFLGRYVADADDGFRGPREVAREQGLRLRMIASALGTRLGPDWTADEVVRLVERHAGVHSVIAPGEAHSPLRYLAVMLERALTSPSARMPHVSPVRQAYEREVLAAELAQVATRTAELRAELDHRDAAAAASRAGGQAGLQAARAVAAAAAQRGALQRNGRPGSSELEPWPEVRRPGGGQADC